MSDAHVIDVYEPALPETFNGKLAMWLFLCSEVMFFAGLMGAYLALRIGQPQNFDASQALLHHHVTLAAFNTALLITSSLTMALAVLAGQKKQVNKQQILLFATAAMGTLFLALKGYEYSTKLTNVVTDLGTGAIVPGPDGKPISDPLIPSRDLFFAFYWGLTAIHGVHILAGVLPILGLGFMCKKKDMSGETEMVGLYWHFVDLVWIFLFPLLYLI